MHILSLVLDQVSSSRMNFSLRSVNGTKLVSNSNQYPRLNIDAVLLALLVVFLPRESLSGCVFGANNTQDLVSRNATIFREMNDTLMSYLNTATMGIRQNLFIPAFSISNRLLKWHNVTSDNLRLFAKDGRLANLTWETETSDMNPNLRVPSFIIKDFVKPAHEALQNISLKYSFSYGIFRPNAKQLHFAGLENSTTLSTNCYAGTYMGFNMTINQQNNDQLRIKNSTKFATLVTLLERAIDTHFRSANSPFTNDFVRVNVLNASLASDKYNTLVQAELYFLNQSRNWTEVLSRLDNLPGIPYVDSRNNNAFINVWGYSLFEIYNAPAMTTLSVSESTIASTTTPISSSTSNTSFTSTSASNHITPANTGNATSSSLSTENTSTTTQLSNTTTSYLTERASTLTAANTPSATSLISTSNSSPNPNASTSVSSVQTHNAPTLTLIQNVTTIASNNTAVTATLTANTTPISKETTNLLTTGISQYTVSVTANSTEIATTPTHSSTNTPSAKFNGTTFDPDPRFLPVVRVIKNVYNDEILIRRNGGKLVPLTERAALYTIAIPAAIVLITMIIGCLVCFQYFG